MAFTMAPTTTNAAYEWITTYGGCNSGTGNGYYVPIRLRNSANEWITANVACTTPSYAKLWVQSYEDDRMGTAIVNGTNWRMIDTSVQITPSMWAPSAPSAQDRLREIIRARQAPMHLASHRRLVLPTADVREIRARETFRRIVGDHNWRRYCTRGFVCARGKSGLVYQLFAGHDLTRVYKDGKLIERLCIYLAGDYPPADTILAKYVMVLSDEEGFRKTANRSVPHPSEQQRRHAPAISAEARSLVDEWRRIRRVA